MLLLYVDTTAANHHRLVLLVLAHHPWVKMGQSHKFYSVCYSCKRCKIFPSNISKRSSNNNNTMRRNGHFGNWELCAQTHWGHKSLLIQLMRRTDLPTAFYLLLYVAYVATVHTLMSCNLCTLMLLRIIEKSNLV